MSNETNVQIRQGTNELSNRALLTKVLHYGQIDSWLSSDPHEVTPLINSNNYKNIPIGTYVKLSDTLFCKLIKLETMVDRRVSKKRTGHIKRSVKSIANGLGYKDRSGLYKVIRPLYEIGLIDVFEQKNEQGQIEFIDISVYPYPIYADSDICQLKKIRNWKDRENSLGFMLSKQGTAKRKEVASSNVVDKSLQGEPVDKSLQGVVDKSLQGVVDKSLHTNNISPSNNINLLKEEEEEGKSTILSNFSFSKKLNDYLNDKTEKILNRNKIFNDINIEQLYIFYTLNKDQIDDTTFIQVFEKVLGYNQNIKALNVFLRNTLDMVLEDIKNKQDEKKQQQQPKQNKKRNYKSNKKVVRKEMLPDFMNKNNNGDDPQKEVSLEELNQLENLLNKYKKNRESEGTEV